LKYLRNLLQPYYLLALLAGGSIFWFDAQQREAVTTFSGFAENLETEINFNHPVIVQAIAVKEGQFVKEGAPLLHLQRLQLTDDMASEEYQIAELRAESAAWRAKKQGDLSVLEARHRLQDRELISEMEELETEIAQKKKLFGRLSTLQDVPQTFTALESELQALRVEKQLRDSLYQQERANLLEELRLGEAPYRSEIERLEARKAFDEAQRVIDIEIKAPFDGLVGNISCKKGEHIRSYNTLMTFYAPNPTLAKGFVYEDQLTNVAMGDPFLIRSAVNPTQTCEGVVTGLGSRVVEIPTRLRKVPEMKIYGREVVVSIPAENPFIQREKVMMERQ
jgi:multidrug resistance efflux pump